MAAAHGVHRRLSSCCQHGLLVLRVSAVPLLRVQSVAAAQPPRLPMTMGLPGYGVMPDYGRPERMMGTGVRPAYIQAGPASCQEMC